ncbi:MAG TPA: lipase maturation factor family protein [Candidatus Polarisedimenticolaceae bacterium]|nr:lipase maturation factor family protein [Candidatus Polarisedimenticolaceae bacterium]
MSWRRPAYWLGQDAAPVGAERRFHLARFLILRLLGLVYFTGFMVLVNQGRQLIGSHGLLPVAEFIPRATQQLGSVADGFLRLPSVFWFAHSDAWLTGLAWAGAILSFLVMIGLTNAGAMLVLWALYMSFVHVGQDWYSYGWEIQLLETGFLAVFLCPWNSWRPFPRNRPAPIVIWLFRWLILRIMVGAGMIKMRGDSCWRDLTCLDYHYETQPNPNPLSRFFHFEPKWLSRVGCAFNHLIELVFPWLMFLGRWPTRVAGIGFVVFQCTLIVSGNLSFLNWLTIVPALACFDDAFLARVLPRAFGRWAEEAELGRPTAVPWRERLRFVTLIVLTVAIGWLSIPVVTNLLSVSGRQIMNTSFDPLDLVNTYGAFGSVGRERREIVFEGTSDANPDDPSVTWREYQFKCAPCEVTRRPCFISPYHYRLDWQIWFAAMARPEQYPWTLRFTWNLLHNDPVTLSLLAGNPFPAAPPRFIRARLYVYRFAPIGSDAWWKRDLMGDWLPPLSTEDPRLIQFLKTYGWLPGSSGS